MSSPRHLLYLSFYQYFSEYLCLSAAIYTTCLWYHANQNISYSITHVHNYRSLWSWAEVDLFCWLQQEVKVNYDLLKVVTVTTEFSISIIVQGALFSTYQSTKWHHHFLSMTLILLYYANLRRCIIFVFQYRAFWNSHCFHIVRCDVKSVLFGQSISIAAFAWHFLYYSIWFVCSTAFNAIFL